MKLNKQLKTEGIVIIICFILMCMGLILWHGFEMKNIFTMILQSPLFVLIVIGALIYWIYQVFKYQKSH